MAHFRQKMLDGTYLIMPGPPREPEEFQPVATNSDKLLAHSLLEHQGSLKMEIDARREKRAKNKAQIFLGSFTEKSIGLFDELDTLQGRL